MKSVPSTHYVFLIVPWSPTNSLGWWPVPGNTPDGPSPFLLCTTEIIVNVSFGNSKCSIFAMMVPINRWSTRPRNLRRFRLVMRPIRKLMYMSVWKSIPRSVPYRHQTTASLSPVADGDSPGSVATSAPPWLLLPGSVPTWDSTYPDEDRD